MGGPHVSNDSCPSINAFTVGNIGNSEYITVGNARFHSTHAEFILNGCLSDAEVTGSAPVRLDSIFVADPTTEPVTYTNIQMLGNRTDGGRTPWEYSAHAQRSDSLNGASWNMDSNFVHFSDSLVVAQLDGPESRTINVDSLLTASNDSATRVSLRSWSNNSGDTADQGSGNYPAGDADRFCNITSPTYQTLRAISMSFIFANQDSIWGSTDETINYNYVDNYLIDYGECQQGYWLNSTVRKILNSTTHGGSSTVSADSVDWDISNSILPNDASVLRTPMWDIAEEYQDSVVAAGFGGGIFNVINSGAVNLKTFCTQVVPGGLFFELRGQFFVDQPYASNGWVAYLARHDSVQSGSPTSKQFWEYRWSGVITDTSSTNAGRLFLASYASFACFQDTLIDHFRFGKVDTDYWFKGHEVDVGLPEAALVDSTMSDTAGNGGQHVIFREYSNGLVLFRPKMTGGADTTIATAVQVDLASAMWLVDEYLDSSSVSTVYIRALEGMRLRDVAAAPSGQKLRRIRK